MTRSLLTAVLLSTLASCGGTERSPAAGDEEKFARVYARLVQLSSSPRLPPPSTPEQVLNDERMTREEFRRTVAEYNRDPRRWESLMGKVQTIIEEEIARSAASHPGTGDSTARVP